MANSFLNDYSKLFTPAELTGGEHSFGDLDLAITFNEAQVIFYGIPLDFTTTFGKGTSRGPEAIRKTSARQIETFVYEEKVDIKNAIPLFDLGDIKLSVIDQKTNNNFLSFLDETIPTINKTLSSLNKKPFVLGGEHTISYFTLKGLSDKKPLILHFDAHRDLKPEYEGLKLCHATHFYRLLNEGYMDGKDIIQIGIRQADENENKIANDNGIVTFDAWKIKKEFKELLKYINTVTKRRNLYISFDIDVFDIPYVPCTGTPEPFGLDPFEVIDILNNIDHSANLIGMDLVEVAIRNNDYREGTLASQILFRILTKNYIH